MKAVSAACRPAIQLDTQEVEEIAKFEYFPGSHLVHEGEASTEYFPALQSVQVLSEVAPVAELYFPASHNVQVEEEVAAVAELLERAWD